MTEVIGNVLVTPENRRRGVYDVPIFKTVTLRSGRYWVIGRVLIIKEAGPA